MNVSRHRDAQPPHTGIRLLFCWIAVLFFSCSETWAQGCVMCKSSLAAQAEAVVASLNLGILILLFPPLAIMSAILIVAFRERE